MSRLKEKILNKRERERKSLDGHLFLLLPLAKSRQEFQIWSDLIAQFFLRALALAALAARAAESEGGGRARCTPPAEHQSLRQSFNTFYVFIK